MNDFPAVLLIKIRSEKLKKFFLGPLVSSYRGWLGGFVTEELREGNSRSGYSLRTLDGETAVLASRALVSPVSFNKYGVNLDALNVTAAAALRRARAEKAAAVVDELGSISLKAPAFMDEVVSLFSSGFPALVTVREGASLFLDTFSALKGCAPVELTEESVADADSAARSWLDFHIRMKGVSR